MITYPWLWWFQRITEYRDPMSIMYLFRGLIIGFSIAAPVGPIGILCIKRSLSSGRLIGLISGMGAATADAFYGSIAAFGLSIISDFFIQQQIWLRLLGGIFLCYLGIKTFFSIPADDRSQVGSLSAWSAYSSTLLLTLTNPLTILSFAAIFSGLGLVTASSDVANAAITVLGVFLGSACWWFILSAIAGFIRTRLNRLALQWVNRISGLVIFGFGLVSLVGSIL
jgi:threonine/homoserine/homoserine lactone efflux protein